MNITIGNQPLYPRLSSYIKRSFIRIRRPLFFGTLRRLTPISQCDGYDRGLPIDRFYIDQFLAEHSKKISGTVLEVGDTRYTDKFGDSVSDSDVVDIQASDKVTILADLAHADSIPSSYYDCVIVSQTLQYIEDLDSALSHLRRILKPNGTLLVTVPSIQRLDGPTDFWRFTPAMCTKYFLRHFGVGAIQVKEYGNLLTAIGAISGIASQELSSAEIIAPDLAYPIIIAVSAQKLID